MKWYRHAGTVIKVTRCTVTVQEDKAIRTDTNGMSESQTYTYEPDPKGAVHVFRKTKNGWKCLINWIRVFDSLTPYF